MLSRRRFIQLTGYAASGLLLPSCHNKALKSLASAHVVIIGGGFGGATAAKTLKQLDPTLQVTLIEPKTHYTTCPGSNWVIAGLKNIQSLSFSYQALTNHYQIKVIHDYVTRINPTQQTVQLNNQQKMHYDRLIVSPGIDFRWDDIEGHNKLTSKQIPHAWKAGNQTRILKNQLHAMPNGGTVIICAPANPFRCPPGPYERASLIAHYLKQHKPRSKLFILDAKNQFSKQALFINAWEKHYGYNTDHSLIEWLPIADNPIVHIDAKKKRITTDFSDQFKADVLNYIPPQKAGHIAQAAALCDNSGWCPVDPKTAESSIYPRIHIIGDAAIYSPLPKSAFAANSEAKICALAVISLLSETDIQQPSWVNTCYSLVSPNQGISVAMVYKLNQQGHIFKVKGAGGVSAKTDPKTLALEASYAKQWLKHISEDSFL